MSCATIDPDDTVALFADLLAGIIECGVTLDVARLMRAVAALASGPVCSGWPPW